MRNIRPYNGFLNEQITNLGAIEDMWCTYFWENFEFNPTGLFLTQEEANDFFRESATEQFGDEIYDKALEWFYDNREEYEEEFGAKQLDDLERLAPDVHKALMDEVFDRVIDKMSYYIQFGYDLVGDLEQSEQNKVLDSLSDPDQLKVSPDLLAIIKRSAKAKNLFGI